MDILSPNSPESNTPLKRCTGPCGRFLPETAEFFHRGKTHKNGLLPKCKECVSAYQKEYHQRPDVQARVKAYQEKPEVRKRKQSHDRKYWKRASALPNVQERKRAYQNTYNQRPEVRERRRIQQKASHSRPVAREWKRAYDKARYHHPEIGKVLRARRKERDSRPETRAKIDAYYSRPDVQERYRVHDQTRRARKKSVSGTYTPQQIQDLLKRQKHACYYCATKFERVKEKYVYHVDHTFPLSRVAGTDIPANSIDYLVLACPTCNMSKGDKFPWEWHEGGRLL